MAVIHNAYPFNPDSFIEVILKFLEKLDANSDGYRKLRSHAISLYENSSVVRLLASNYGGWTRDAIENQIAKDNPQEIYDVLFWFSIILYSLLQVNDYPEFGLGEQYDFLEDDLSSFGWGHDDNKMLLYGRSFDQLLKIPSNQFLESLDKLDNFWNFFSPYTTSGKSGWMNTHDVKRLLRKLKEDESKKLDIIKIRGDKTKIDRINILKRAMEMLEVAESERSGLCILISG